MCSLKNTFFLNIAALLSCESSLLPETGSGDATVSFNSGKLRLYRLPFSQVISHQLGLSPLHVFLLYSSSFRCLQILPAFLHVERRITPSLKKKIKIVLLDVQISKKPKKLESYALCLVRQCLFFGHAWLPMIIIIPSN